MVGIGNIRAKWIALHVVVCQRMRTGTCADAVKLTIPASCVFRPFRPPNPVNTLPLNPVIPRHFRPCLTSTYLYIILALGWQGISQFPHRFPLHLDLVRGVDQPV